MVAYSFKARFADPILAGTKTQTIRGPRARHARVGEQVQLYIGMRTKHCRLIGRSVCESVRRIDLDVNGAVFFPDKLETMRDERDLEAFAIRDGFADWADLQKFWRQNHAGVLLFDGALIGWGALLDAPETG